MTHPSNIGPHLDADQLSAFAEGMLPEHERHHALTHLAECTECRQIVFLTQEPLPASTSEPLAEPFWRRWFGPLVLTGAAAAVAALVFVSLNPHRPSPLPSQNEATNRAPVPQPPNPPSNAASVPPPAKRSSEIAKQPSAKKFPAVAPPSTEPPPKASPASHSQAEGFAPNADKATSTAGMRAVHGSGTAAPIPPTGTGLATSAPAPPPTAQRYKQLQNTAASTTLANSAGEATSPVAKKPPAPAFGAPANSLNLRMQPNQTSIDAFSAINGSVTDPSGATIAGATITLRQLPGSATTQTATDASGQFTIPTLPAGKYEMQIASPGFQSLTRQIDLKPHDLAQLDSKLTLGAATGAVTVEAANDQIITQSATTTGLVANREVALPGKRKTVITVASGVIALALDSTGQLHIRRGGDRWKKVHASWPGKVVQLSLTPASNASASQNALPAPLPPFAAPPPVFRLSTSGGSIWLSSDGEHWRPL